MLALGVGSACDKNRILWKTEELEGDSEGEDSVD